VQQKGIQYAMLEDLWENDAFLNEVRTACEAQGVPLTTIHCEFAPGQWEINTHHVSDPLVACDHALLLKRIVKGLAFKHGIAASFMAKPFGDSAGCGLHVHTSLYNSDGENVFAGPEQAATPAISASMRHAIGGLAQTMPEAMAIFAPNANSYRRFVPGTYVPLSPCWGYNHRDVSLRIPVSNADNRRVEHRVSGADANPYLVVAAILAGIHHGIREGCEPGPMVPENTEIPDFEAVLPRRWEHALEAFTASTVLPEYLGEDYCNVFATMRRTECEAFHAQVTDLDYAWYLRAV
jgi:glutamine synthetase